MRREEQYLIRCLDTFLCGTSPYTGQTDAMDWPYFLRIARIHQVAGMVYLALKDSTSVPAEVLEQLKHQFDFTISCSVRRRVLNAEIEDVFCKAGIPHIYFKGRELCQYYPVPEVRLMSDVDILIRRQDRKRAEEALEKAGFQQKSQNITGYTFCKNQLFLEVHSEFARGPKNGADFRAWSVGGFENGVFPEGSCTGYFRPSFHFLYLVYHLAKHFHSTGAGIRMFLDLAVFWNHYEGKLDWEEIRGELIKMRLDSFAEIIFWYCNHWFGTSIPMEKEPKGELKASIEEYVFAGGVFGHEKRSFSDLFVRKAVTEENLGKRRSQKAKTILRFFFPERTYMELFLPQVRSFPILLPAAWMIRWYQGFFYRRKKGLRSLKNIGQGHPEAEKEYRMLKGLGLIR